MSCARDRTDLGVYVLGALEPTERADLEAHLASCPDCREELAALAGLPGLLSRLTLAEAERGAQTPSPRVLEGLLAAAAHRHRQRRLALVAAAAVLVVAAGSGGLVASHALDHAPPRGQVLSAASGPVSAQATLVGSSSGTQISLKLGGVPAGQRCQLLVVTRTGRNLTTGSWWASGGGYAQVTETAAVAPAELSALRVETLSGRLLVSLRV
jgi:predicted anti-sigma-YlaC factor YlaD